MTSYRKNSPFAEVAGLPLVPYKKPFPAKVDTAMMKLVVKAKTGLLCTKSEYKISRRNDEQWLVPRILA